MTSSTPTSPSEADLNPNPDEIVPDYSRIGFKDLRALCKLREIPADGNGPALIEKLKAFDAQHGLAVDTTVPEGAGNDDEIDLLADEDETPGTSTPAPESESEPEPARELAPVATEPGCLHPLCILDHPHAGPAVLAVPPTPPAPLETPAETPPGGVAEVASPSPSPGGPAGVTADARTFRSTFVIGRHDITDDDHFRMIADTHAAAAAAGLQTKGGITVGSRIGYSVDGNGQRTTTYEVLLRRMLR